MVNKLKKINNIVVCIMSKYMPVSFSLAGVNPQVFFLCQKILLFENDRHLRRSLLAILGDMRLVHFCSPRTIQEMLMHGEMLRVLLQLLTIYGNPRHFRIPMRMILKRILNRGILQLGAPQIKRCMQIISSYIRDSDMPPPVSISLNFNLLNFIRNADYYGSHWFYLFCEFSNPRALQHLIPSDNPNVQLAIVVREFRKMFSSRNQVFMNLVNCESEQVRKRTFFMFSKTRRFKQFNRSFKILQKVFRADLHPSLSHYEKIERIFDLFFKLMNETNPRTFTFLSRVFAEESSKNLQALIELGERNIDYYEFFSFPYQYPGFNPEPRQDSIQLLERLQRVHSLKFSQELLKFLKRHSDNYHDAAWKSIWACGLYWIMKLSSIIQNGDPFLNFIFRSILEGQDSVFYFDALQLFLNGAKIVEDSSYPEFVKFWVQFKNMRGRYIESGRRVSFSDMFFIFLDILENPYFFGGLRQFCSEKFTTQAQFQQIFAHFVQIMQNTAADQIFREFFYPHVFVRCKNCHTEIYTSRYLKLIKMCETCSGYDPSLLTDDDD